GGAWLVAHVEVSTIAVDDAPLNRVGRMAPDAAILDVHAIVVGDEVGRAFLHPEDLGLVAGPIGGQHPGIHRVLARLNRAGQPIANEAGLRIEAQTPARDERGWP